MNLNIIKKIDNNIEIGKKQDKFLETTLGKTINTAIDIGIRTLLPDFIDEQIINLKDNLLNYGLREGLEKTIHDTIETGKSAIGIFTGKFDNINQMQNAVKTGGIIDGVSSLLDMILTKTKQAGLVSPSIVNTIRQGKNVILTSIENNIEDTFNKQINSFENVNKYIDNWKEQFEKQNFEKMDKEYKKLEKELKNLIPLENIIKEARNIENIHLLIKNNGQNFNLTPQEKELIQKL
jgi:hypothetical protein